MTTTTILVENLITGVSNSDDQHWQKYKIIYFTVCLSIENYKYFIRVNWEAKFEYTVEGWAVGAKKIL